jgi:uncharacterized protein
MTSSFSHYDAFITPTKRALESLSHILEVAEAHADAATFPTARLYEDMNPFTFQIHKATEMAEKTIVEFTGKDNSHFEDSLSSYAEMHDRIKAVLAVAEEADQDIVNANGNKIKPTELGKGRFFEVAGSEVASSITMPNMYFHIAMAYAILRNLGVPLGKMDYLMSFLGPVLQRPRSTSV